MTTPPPPPPGDEWPTQGEPAYVDETVVRPAYAPEPTGVPPPEPPDSRIGKGLLLGLLAVALVAGAILAYYLLHNRNDDKATTTTTAATTTVSTVSTRVSVPRVVGLTEQEALVRLVQAGLRPKERFQPTKQAKGVVVSQNPAQATDAARGSQITIVIDSGAPAVAIPDVKGLSAARATATLDEAGLDSTQTQVTSSERAGTVVDEAPAPGQRVKKGSSITLSIAKSAPVAVPDVVGQPEADARAALQQAGLTVNTHSVPGPPPKAQVLAQNPPAGAKGAAGSAVRINVSDGTGSSGGTTTATTGTTSTATTGTTTTTTSTTSTTPSVPATATVPDVSGQTEAAAAQAFAQAGVLASVVFVPSQDPLGQVEQQAKPAGTTVKRFAHVQINISRGPGTKPAAAVPSVLGKTLDEALAALNGAKLRLIYLKLPVTSQAQAGKVVQQSPLTGANAPQNAQVIVYLGSFKR